MSVSGAFRYKLFPVPKGTYLFPELPSQTEDTLWHHLPGGEFSPRGAQGRANRNPLVRSKQFDNKFNKGTWDTQKIKFYSCLFLCL